MAHPGGRPAMFETAEQLQAAIDDYLENGIREKPVLLGKTIMHVKVPTITGLCWYIGFASRQSFYDYEDKPEFAYTIKRARLYIEREYEEMLGSGINPSGPIFALKNMGWSDKTQQEISGPNGGPVSNEVTLKIVRGNNTATE